MAKLKTNRPELDDLSDAERSAVLTGADAIVTLKDFARRSFDLWMDIARGVAVLRKLADQRSSRRAFRSLLRDNGYGSLNDTAASRLVLMAKYETAIRIWRDGELTERQRERWNSPTSICQRCPAVRKAIEATKGPGLGAARTFIRPRIPFETALDAVTDHLLAVPDADHRAAMIERVASTIGITPSPTNQDEVAPASAPDLEPQILRMVDDESLRDVLAKWAKGRSVKECAAKAWHLVSAMVENSRGGIVQMANVQAKEDTAITTIEFGVPKAKGKRGKQPSAKAAKAKGKAADGALVWQSDENIGLGNQPGYVTQGYRIVPNTVGLASGTVSYDVVRGDQTLGRRLTLDAAKSIAQADYAKRRGG
jgi:hypothetical protein